MPEPTPTAAVPHVYAAICDVAGAIAKIGIAKGRENADQKFKFRGIDDVYNALAPILASARLCILPRVMSRTASDVPTRSGGILHYVVLAVEFDLVSAADGSMHTVAAAGEAMDSSDKATNKAMSAAYKYMAMQVFCIPTEGENDADAVTPSPVAAEPTKPADTSASKAPKETAAEKAARQDEHDPAWDGSRGAYFATLAKLGISGEDAQRYCMSLLKCRPSQLSPPRQRKFLDHLADPDGRVKFKAFIAPTGAM